jgi:antirestriction protein ArdC
MTHENAKKLADEALEKLAAALEQGHSEALRAYLAVMGRFHQYSWGNSLLIASQRPTATRVAGFHTWRRLVRHVKKGEKGIMILAPVVVKKRVESEDGEDEQTRVFGFRAAYVFDQSQTDGDPLPEFAAVQGDPQQYTHCLRNTIAEAGISIRYNAEIAPAHGMSRGGAIEVLPGLSAAEEFSVLVHEFAHERLHKGERRAQTSKTVRETEAEAVAFVVTSSIGLQTSTAAADYIQLYNGDRNTLAESLSFIQSTATEILRAIAPGDVPPLN